MLEQVTLTNKWLKNQYSIFVKYLFDSSSKQFFKRLLVNRQFAAKTIKGTRARAAQGT